MNVKKAIAMLIQNTLHSLVLAYVLAPHQEQALVKLVNLLKPFGINL